MSKVNVKVIAFALVILVASTLASTVIAQSVTIEYTIHVDFFAYSCSLDITKVSLYDPSGDLLGVATSPYGGEVAISIRTPIPFLASQQLPTVKLPGALTTLGW